MKNNLKELFFFKDRLNVGRIVQNIDNLNEEINSISSQIEFYENKIRLLRSKRIKFFENSIEKNLINLKKILNIKNNK